MLLILHAYTVYLDGFECLFGRAGIPGLCTLSFDILKGEHPIKFLLADYSDSLSSSTCDDSLSETPVHTSEESHHSHHWW